MISWEVFLLRMDGWHYSVLFSYFFIIISFLFFLRLCVIDMPVKHITLVSAENQLFV